MPIDQLVNKPVAVRGQEIMKTGAHRPGPQHRSAHRLDPPRPIPCGTAVYLSPGGAGRAETLQWEVLMVSRSESGVARTSADRDRIRTVALVVSVVFLLVGVLGFIPGITTNYGSMQFAGHDSGAKLLGAFQVSILHNIVHLLFGIVGLALARTVGGARLFLIGGGAIYLVLWLYGLIIDHGSGANFVPLNTGDNWLHFFLGVGMVALGLIFAPRSGRTTRP
jgi:hypothetical protein